MEAGDQPAVRPLFFFFMGGGGGPPFLFFFFFSHAHGIGGGPVSTGGRGGGGGGARCVAPRPVRLAGLAGSGDSPPWSWEGLGAAQIAARQQPQMAWSDCVIAGPAGRHRHLGARSLPTAQAWRGGDFPGSVVATLLEGRSPSRARQI